MLKTKKQHEYIRTRCDNILACIVKFGKDRDAEELHKLRVETKKLKAYAAFASKLTGKNLKKKLDAVTKVFKKAGEIRAANLNLAAIKQYGIRSPGFKKGHQAIAENGSEQFITSSERYMENIKAACNSLQDECRDIGDKKIYKFYEKRISTLSSFFRENFDEKNLHSRRKIIKVLLYVRNLLSEKLRQELALNVSYLDALQDTAGKWHDAIVFIELLETAAASNSKKPERLIQEKEGLLQAVKSLGAHFEKNLSLKKAMYTGP